MDGPQAKLKRFSGATRPRHYELALV